MHYKTEIAINWKMIIAIFRVTTCLENLEMSENMTGILLKITEMSGNCQGKILSAKVAYLVGGCCVLNVKYMVLDHVLLLSYTRH